MALFNRKAKNRDHDENVEPTQKEKVKFSKRPASMCRECVLGMTLLLTMIHRYRLQTTATEGMAAHLDPQGGASHVIPHWSHIRSNWSSDRLG